MADQRAEEAQGLDSLLRKAYRRAQGLSAEDRRRVLELCLAHRLAGQDQGRVREVLRRVAGRFGAEEGREGVPTLAARPAVVAGGEPSPLPGGWEWLLGTRDAPGGLPEAAREAEAAVGTLRAMASKELAGAPLGEVVRHVAARLSTQERALERAAQELTDRLMEAFDPEGARAGVRKGMLTSETSHKAAVYDALCEKFSQLREYHQRGRLVRDFRSMFRKYQKQME